MLSIKNSTKPATARTHIFTGAKDNDTINPVRTDPTNLPVFDNSSFFIFSRSIKPNITAMQV